MTLSDASRVATLVLTVAMVTLLLRHELFAHGPAGVTLQVLAGLLMLWARLTFGRRSFHAAASPTAGGMVTSGPYHFLRHPIYAAILIFIWASLPSNLSVVSATAVLVATASSAVRIYAEERLLVQRYPEYAAYAAHTKRMIPYVI